MQDPVEALVAARRLLSPGGFVLAFLDTPMGAIKIQNALEPYVIRDQPAAEDFSVNSQTVVSGLRAADVNFSVQAIPTELDLTVLYDNTDESKFKRHEFLSFFTQVEFSTAPRPYIDDAEFLLSSVTIRQNQQVIMQHPTAAIMIPAKNLQ